MGGKTKVELPHGESTEDRERQERKAGRIAKNYDGPQRGVGKCGL